MNLEERISRRSFLSTGSTLLLALALPSAAYSRPNRCGSVESICKGLDRAFWKAGSRLNISEAENHMVYDPNSDEWLSYRNFYMKYAVRTLHRVRDVPKEYREYVNSFGWAYDVSPAFLAAMIYVESNWNPRAVSPTGCAGLAQICIPTAKGYGMDVCSQSGGPNMCSFGEDERLNPKKAIEAGAHIASDYLKKFEEYEYSLELTAAAYNSGVSLIKKAIEETGRSDPSWLEVSDAITPEFVHRFFPGYSMDFAERKTEEIKNHVDRVMSAYAELAHDSYVFRRWPIDDNIAISSSFGWRTLNGKKDFHDGIDIAVPAGTKVYPVMEGEVIDICEDYCGGYGNSILIKHADDLYTRYNHLSGIDVRPGDMVDIDQVIGESGNTGHSFGPHLHITVFDFPVYRIRGSEYKDKGANPLDYLPPINPNRS